MSLFPYIQRQNPLIPKHPENLKSGFQGKVFCIGFYKTGTSSLARALKILGFKKYGLHLEKPTPARLITYGYSPIGSWYKDQYLPNHLGVDDISWLFHHPWFLNAVRRASSQASIFADGPWLYLYRIFNEWYPESKFILTVRDSTQEVVNSDLKQIARNKQQGKLLNFKELSSKKVFGISIQDHLMLFARNYEKHNSNVRTYFYAEGDFEKKLLVLNLKKDKGNVWQKLSDFLNCPVPSIPFPHLNSAHPQQSSRLLPDDFQLKWNINLLCGKLKTPLEFIHSYEEGKTDNQKYFNKLKSFYMPLKPENLNYPEKFWEDSNSINP